MTTDNSEPTSMKTEYDSYPAAEPAPHQFQDLQRRINEKFVETLKGVFEARLELDTKNTSRLVGSQVRTPEEVKAELQSLQNSLSKLMTWAETTQKQIAKTLDPNPPQKVIEPISAPREPKSWLKRLIQRWTS